ncbi:hypothetical protein [Pseudomonas sp. EA_5y_Pfl2_R50]|uniref:hypothetical protein n=1 Tax=Pseudomonas sp. EA_5y_Pfl2_R50 TaxID=3088691 RepID=UPI0030D88080
MRDASNDDKPTVVTLVNGDTTRISFGSGSVNQNQIHVHTAEGNRINVQMPGMDVTLNFDLDQVSQVQAASAQSLAESEKPLRLFTCASVLITLSFLIIVGSVSFWLGFCLGTGYFGYRWYRVSRQKKSLAARQSGPPAPAKDQAKQPAGGMSRQSVRDSLARKR